MKKNFFKKSSNPQKLLQFGKNRLEVLVLADNRQLKSYYRVTTELTIVGISHFFLLQFEKSYYNFVFLVIICLLSSLIVQDLTRSTMKWWDGKKYML